MTREIAECVLFQHLIENPADIEILFCEHFVEKNLCTGLSHHNICDRVHKLMKEWRCNKTLRNLIIVDFLLYAISVSKYEHVQEILLAFKVISEKLIGDDSAFLSSILSSEEAQIYI